MSAGARVVAGEGPVSDDPQPGAPVRIVEQPLWCCPTCGNILERLDRVREPSETRIGHWCSRCQLARSLPVWTFKDV